MAQTYLQIQRQIESLQRKAERLRAIEVKGVVDRIRVAIDHYGLTAEQLGLAAAGKSSTSKSLGKSTPASAKFSDRNGNVWSGRGPRPHWLRSALDSGRSLEEFRSVAHDQRAAGVGESAATATAKRSRKSKRAGTIRYRDDAGHAWSGRGPRPGWLKAALDAGKTLDEFAAT